MPRPKDYQERQAVNDKSRTGAEHHSEPWEGYEQELLMEWDGTEGQLLDLAEMLGRTVEACRQRYYTTRKGNTRSVTRRVTTTTTVEHKVTWQDDEEWPDWYVRG